MCIRTSAPFGGLQFAQNKCQVFMTMWHNQTFFFFLKHSLEDVQNGHTTLENTWTIFTKLNICLSYDTASLCPDPYSQVCWINTNLWDPTVKFSQILCFTRERNIPIHKAWLVWNCLHLQWGIPMAAGRRHHLLTLWTLQSADCLLSMAVASIQNMGLDNLRKEDVTISFVNYL